MTIKINSVEKLFSQADNSEMLDVNFTFGKVTRRLLFALDTTKKQIKEELKAYVDNHEQELKMAKENEKREKADKQADKLIESLTGQEI
jgi:hypothetical protein